MYPAKPNNTKQKALATVLTLLAVVIVTGSVAAFDHKNNARTVGATSTAPTSTADTSGQTSMPSSSTSSNFSSYKDGTYTASSDYFVPHGDESIKVTLTVQSGVVTNSQIVNSENDGESVAYQESFASEYKSFVVGKKLSEIRLGYVAGASDTAQAFNDALGQIRNQAQA